MKNLISLFVLVLLLIPGEANAQTDTTAVDLEVFQGTSHCAYRVDLDLSAIDSTALYETQAFFIGDVDASGLTTYISPSADTVGVTIDVSNDLSNWYTLSWAEADSITSGTHLDFNPAGLDGFRYARFDAGWTNGSVGTVTLEAFVRKRSGSNDGCRVVDSQ